jgi:pilus assembly protein CpaB
MARQFGSSAIYRPPNSSSKLVPVIVAGVCLVAAVAIVISATSGPTKDTQVKTLIVEKPPEIEMVDVLIPVQNLDTGAEFMPDMFRVERRPKVGLSSRTVTSFQQIQGQFAKGPINAEQPMNADVVTRVKPINVISANIPEGFRAVTIPVDAKTSVEGWAKAGARVDVAWTGIRNGKPTIVTIVYNAKVLSADRNANNNPNEGAGAPSTVTLLVVDEDAAKIQLAMTAGSLSLQLRGDSDRQVAIDPNKPAVVTMDSIFKDNAAPSEKKKRGVIKVKRPDGGYDEMFLGEDGRLEPN